MDRVMMQRVPHMCGAGGASVVCAIQFPTKIAPKNKFPTKNTAPTRPAHAPTRAIHSCWLKRAVAEREANRALQHTPKQASTHTLPLPRAERRAGLKKNGKKERKESRGLERAKQPASMAAAGGGSGAVVKHIVLARFKEEVTPERLDKLIRGYAALVDAVPSMKSFHW